MRNSTTTILIVCALFVATNKPFLIDGFSTTTTTRLPRTAVVPASTLRIGGKNHAGGGAGGGGVGWQSVVTGWTKTTTTTTTKPLQKSSLFAETDKDGADAVDAAEQQQQQQVAATTTTTTTTTTETVDDGTLETAEESAKDEGTTIDDTNGIEADADADADGVASEEKEKEDVPDTDAVAEVGVEEETSEEVVEEDTSEPVSVAVVASDDETAEAEEDTHEEDVGDDSEEAVAADATEKPEDDEEESIEDESEESVAVANEETDVVDDDDEEEEEEEDAIKDADTVGESQADADEEEQETTEEAEDVNETEGVAASLDSEGDDNTATAKTDDDDDDDDSEDAADGEVVIPAIYTDSEDAPEKKIFYAVDKEKDEVAEKVQGLDLELIANVAGDIARDFLSVLRFRTANLLTSSLPDDQRDELLSRMGASAISLPPADTDNDGQTNVVDDDAALAEGIVSQTEEEEEQRASINEEIALARAEEAQRSEKKWEREKAEILSEMEEAANARVENELKIQRMKLEQETAKALGEKEEAMKAEKERLEQAIEEERKRAEALAAGAEKKETTSSPDDVDDLFVVGTDEEESRNKELEALLEKRQEQQAALESIEEELRASVVNEEEQRDRLQEILTKRQAQQEELDTVEGDLRKQVREIESEKARYKQLLADLEAMKSKEQELREKPVPTEADEESSSPDNSEDDETTAAAEDEESKEDPEHPVLGPVIADLGYKRIHFVSAGRLGTIPVWSRNRTYRNNRAKSMATEKLKTMDLGFPGVICLHEAPSGKLSIVDGQHRVGMMAALKELINKKTEKGDEVPDIDAAYERVLVEVYPEPIDDEEDKTSNTGGEGFAKSASDGFAEKIFVEINKAEPVKLIDMPGVASAADRKIITEAVEILQDQYMDMFSASQRCRVPNVNVDNLRSMIFGANILKKHKLTTSKKLTEWLMEQNAALGDEYENSKTKQELFSKKQWGKASSNNFYLGLESSWLYK